MSYQTILFDLDGTLTEPAEGITNSVAYALAKFGITVSDREELLHFIGPPLMDSFMEYYGFDEAKARQAVAYYREYFSVKGLFENSVIQGIKELLEELQAAGKQLVVATSKPEYFSLQILEKFDLLSYFTFVAGATMDETRTRKADVIAYALEHISYESKASTVMVGDRHHDIEGARALGLDAIGVTFGYGSREELQGAGATYVVDTIAQLRQRLL